MECQENGQELADTFPYTWDGAELDTEKINGVYSAGHETVAFDSSNSVFEKNYEITNKLKTEEHTVVKNWNDDANNNIPNYYNTRPDEIHVKLQRTINNPPTENSTWDDVYPDEQLDVTDADKEKFTTSYNAISNFQNLPQYDKNGNKYYYRVLETYIGPPDTTDNYKTDKIYEDNSGSTTIKRPATYIYYVMYDENYTDTSTSISNHLIRKTEYQNFYAKKIWNDNNNQDGKRKSITVTFRQYTLIDNNEANQKIQRISIPFLKRQKLWTKAITGITAGQTIRYRIQRVINTIMM